MRLCRFNSDQLGLLDGDQIADVSAALDTLPAHRWSAAFADPVIARLPKLMSTLESRAASAPRLALGAVTLEAPVARPSKIIGAPVNYHAHLDEAQQDRDLHQGRTVHPIDEIGCFLKAGSSLIGSGATIDLPAGMDRVDYEGEVAVIIGRPAKAVQAADALAYVAGFALALDMTVRGKQDRSMRKSCDGFSVLGPALVTPDAIADTAAIPFELQVNGAVRQSADTSLLIRSVPELIEMCSTFYTLHPGDVIMTGTPAGVGPVQPGDEIAVTSPDLGRLTLRVQ
ncbi:MAG: fumarylacetoacetate hydrolase family protein [Pseudomonadota bacterium]